MPGLPGGQVTTSVISMAVTPLLAAGADGVARRLRSSAKLCALRVYLFTVLACSCSLLGFDSDGVCETWRGTMLECRLVQWFSVPPPAEGKISEQLPMFRRSPRAETASLLYVARDLVLLALPGYWVCGLVGGPV